MIRSVKSIDSIPSPIPIGTIIDYYGTSQPDGWLICDGREVPSYMTKLRELIGNATPDLRGLFRRMIGGNAAGVGIRQEDIFKAHKHDMTRKIVARHGRDGTFDAVSNYALDNDGEYYNCIDLMTETGGIETRPVNMAFNVIIYGGGVRLNKHIKQYKPLLKEVA